MLAADPGALIAWITQRITPFVAAGIPLDSAGGPGAGYSTDDGQVYINLSQKGETEVIRVDFAHDFYHRVQHVAQARAGTLKNFDFDATVYNALSSNVAKRCYATRELFGNLTLEGTASYVGDIALFPSSGEEALSVRNQREASLSGRVDKSISLLEIALAAMTVDNPVPEKSVYGMGFLYAGQIYYDLGYVIAKAVA